MRTWIGRLLVTAAALSLVLLLVLLIGSEQFTALFINQTLSAENSAFGTLLLIILQSVTYKTLLWMAVVAAGLFCIGFLILFFNKPKTKRETADIVEEEIPYQEADEEMLEAKQAMAEAVSVNQRPMKKYLKRKRKRNAPKKPAEKRHRKRSDRSSSLFRVLLFPLVKKVQCFNR